MTVGRYVYANRQMVKEDQARLSPFDRGFLWADGVYEITPCFNRRLIGWPTISKDSIVLCAMFGSIPEWTGRKWKRQRWPLLDANVSHREEESIYKVGHWVTRGMDNPSTAAS